MLDFMLSRSKSKTNYQQASRTQAHIDSGVVLAECILRLSFINDKHDGAFDANGNSTKVL
jgi:hypothetical protein